MLPTIIKISAIEKYSSPKWIKMIRSGKLSEKALKILANAGYKDRTIKHLGVGGTRVSDLVFTSRVGKAVRKIPNIEGVSKYYIHEPYNSQAKEHFVWNKVQKYLSKKKIKVPRLIKQDGPIGYYEHVKGRSVANKAKKLFNKLDEYGKQGDRVRRIRVKNAKLRMLRILNKSPIDAKTMRKIKRKYPRIYDMTNRNLVDRTLVDFDILGPQTYTMDRGPSKHYRDTYKAFANGMRTTENYKKTFPGYFSRNKNKIIPSVILGGALVAAGIREAKNKDKNGVNQIKKNAMIKFSGMLSDIASARKATNANPSEAQIKAENYKKVPIKARKFISGIIRKIR